LMLALSAPTRPRAARMNIIGLTGVGAIVAP
jgi:hypothetical protein